MNTRAAGRRKCTGEAARATYDGASGSILDPNLQIRSSIDVLLSDELVALHSDLAAHGGRLADRQRARAVVADLAAGHGDRDGIGLGVELLQVHEDPEAGVAVDHAIAD